MKCNIKYLIESFFDNAEEIESEESILLHGEKLVNDMVYKDIYSYFYYIHDLDIRDLLSLYPKNKNLLLFTKALNNVSVKDILDPKYTLVIEYFYLLKDVEEDIALKLLKVLYSKDLKCKVLIHTLRIRYSPKEFNFYSDNVKITFLDIYKMLVRDLSVIPNNVENEVVFILSVLLSFSGYSLDHMIGFDFTNSVVPLDWKDLPEVKTCFEINLYGEVAESSKNNSSCSEDELQKSIDAITRSLQSLKNFPSDFFVNDDDLFVTKHHLVCMRRSWATPVKLFFRKYIKELVKRDIPNKEDQQKIYKMFTIMT